MRKAMEKKLSVLILDAEVPVALSVVRCLAQCSNFKLHLLSSRRWNQCRFSRHHDSHVVRSTMVDYEEYFKATVEIVKRFDIDVILPVTIGGIEFVSAKYQSLSEFAALPSLPSQQSFRIAGNKWLLTEIARNHHIPVPKSVFVTLDSTFYQQLSSLEYPVLLKPTVEAGGRGIRRFENPSDLKRFLEEQDEDLVRSRYLVQDYLPGSTLGLNVLCREGEILAFTMQKYLVAKDFEPPTAIQFIEREDMLEYGRKLVSALNWSGVANIDMRYDRRNGQVRLLEVNPRFWATLLGSLVVGVNFPYLSCLEALKLPFPVPQYELGMYVRMGTTVKESLRRLFGRSNLDGFAFGETDLRFFFADPMPEIVDYAARGVRRCYEWRLVPPRAFKPVEGFLADWFPLEYSQPPEKSRRVA